MTGGGYGGWVEGGEGGAMGDDGEGYGGWIPASAGKTDVGVGGSRIVPTVKSGRWGMMGKGNHEGCFYGGVDGVVVGEPVR